MPGLINAEVVSGSPLKKYAQSNLWVTADPDLFLSHLRHVALRQSPNWGFKVVTDSNLMTAWLANTALQGKGIMDADALMQAASVSLTSMTLVDLVEPPETLIIRLGVKSARNQAMPEVFLEAIQHRKHLGRPTWVWDQPMYPFAMGHLCYSPEGAELVNQWDHFNPFDLKTIPVAPVPVIAGSTEIPKKKKIKPPQVVDANMSVLDLIALPTRK
jgi:hypothetical protein